MKLLIWINVKDELPDAEQAVLVYSSTADEPVWLGYYDGESWSDICNDFEIKDVTHWMPLPEPPL